MRGSCAPLRGNFNNAPAGIFTHHKLSQTNVWTIPGFYPGARSPGQGSNGAVAETISPHYASAQQGQTDFVNDFMPERSPNPRWSGQIVASSYSTASDRLAAFSTLKIRHSTNCPFLLLPVWGRRGICKKGLGSAQFQGGLCGDCK